MTITIKVSTDNAAFEDKDAEIARLLHKIALQWPLHDSTLRDFNGNSVGSVTVKGK